MTTTVYLVRHGEYENPDYLFPGRLQGFPLSETGKKQAEKLATYFQTKHVAYLYSSPLQRTKETADIIGNALHIPVKLDDRLQEVKTLLDGESMLMFDDTDGGISYTPELHAKGAESIEDLARRMRGCIEEIRNRHKGKTLVIVTHGDPMRYVVMKYRRMPMDFALSRSVAIPLGGGYALGFDEHGKFMEDSFIPPA